MYKPTSYVQDKTTSKLQPDQIRKAKRFIQLPISDSLAEVNKPLTIVGHADILKLLPQFLDL